MTNQEAVEYLDKYVMNVAPYGKWKEVVERAISALQEQDSHKPTAESVQNVQNEDLISRKAAIDVAENAFVRGLLASPDIRKLPSVHPKIEERKEESAQNVPKEDLISRKEAIEAMGKAQWAKERLMELPSAQPETSKRIVGKSRNGMTLWYQCDMCNEPVDAQDNFCRGCGRRLTDG